MHNVGIKHTCTCTCISKQKALIVEVFMPPANILKYVYVMIKLQTFASLCSQISSVLWDYK